MGIREFVLDRAKKEGIEKGISQRNLEIATSLILETDFDDEKIAKITGVSVAYVSDLRKQVPG